MVRRAEHSAETPFVDWVVAMFGLGLGTFLFHAEHGEGHGPAITAFEQAAQDLSDRTENPKFGSGGER